MCLTDHERLLVIRAGNFANYQIDKEEYPDSLCLKRSLVSHRFRGRSNIALEYFDRFSRVQAHGIALICRFLRVSVLRASEHSRV